MPDVTWRFAAAVPGWTVPYSVTGQSVNSLVYVRFTVYAIVNGSAYNPTSDTVRFAFLPQATALPTTPPTSGQWVTGAWVTTTVSGQTTYQAECLVGPGGTFVPTAATNYWVWMQVTDNPEIPVQLVGELKIT